MRPITVLTLIILGSCVAISVCLIVVWALLFLTAQNPELTERITPELNALPKHIYIFIPLTVLCAQSFLSMQKQQAKRWWWQAAMWIAIVALGFYYVNSV